MYNSLISLSISTMRLFESTINWYSGSASIGPITAGEDEREVRGKEETKDREEG